METPIFEELLSRVCSKLTQEAREGCFKNPKSFEQRVREVLDDLSDFAVDMSPPAQAFPDVVLGSFGVEVKFSSSDTWRSIANSILESQRVLTVKDVYIIFGKMGGTPEVRWGRYEEKIVHLRTSHAPRFEIDMESGRSWFERMGVKYDDFRLMSMEDKMVYARRYAREIHPDKPLWWEDRQRKKVSFGLMLRWKLPPLA